MIVPPQLFQVMDTVLLPLALVSVMFAVGMSLPRGSFRRVFRARRAFLVGLLNMLVFVPAIGIGAALLFGPTPGLVIGLVLLATCPSGILSNVLTDIAKGDVALSISLSVALSLAYVVTLPIVLHFIGPADADARSLPAIALATSLLKVVALTLLPVLFGSWFRALAPVGARRYAATVKSIATAALLLMFAVIIWREWQMIETALGTLLLIVIGMNLANLALAFISCAAANLSPRERITMRIEHVMRQEGTAIFVAVTILGSTEAAVPLIVNTLVGMVISAVLIGTASARFTPYRVSAKSQA